MSTRTVTTERPERTTIPVGPPPLRPRRRLPIANPMASAVLSRVTTRFRAATEAALAAESEQGRAATFIAALTDFLERGGPAPAALRSALSNPAVQTEVTP